MDYLDLVFKTHSGKGWMEIGSVSYIFGWISVHAIWVIPLTVFVTVQIIKIVFHLRKNGWKLENVLMYGHMPSAHSAIGISAVISTALFDPNHLRSGAFGIALLLEVVIIGDALNFRMLVGEHAKHLNKLYKRLNDLSEKMGMKKEKPPNLNERVGHRFKEVVAGTILGVVLTLVFAWILW